MFQNNEDIIVRNKVCEFVQSKMIPVEKIRNDSEDVPNEIASPLRSFLINEGLIGKRDRSACSSLVIYEELHRSLLGFWGAGVIDGAESVGEGIFQKEGIYPVLTTSWIEVKPNNDEVMVSGSFSTIGDSHCQWYWLDNHQILIHRDDPGVTRHSRRGVGIHEVSKVTLNHAVGKQYKLKKLHQDIYSPQIIQLYLRLGAGAVGSCLRGIEEVIDYSKTRITFGQPLSERQAIQWEFANLAREVQAIRLPLYESASMLERDPFNQENHELAMLASADAISTGISILDRVIQIFGGKGYTRSFWVEEAFRNLLGYQAFVYADDIFIQTGKRLQKTKQLSI
jgi:hypothetical protein